jgi:glycine/D-amino acid oxidase-like deaminating enzyme
MTVANASHPWVALTSQKAELPKVTRSDIDDLRAAAADLVDAHGRRTAALQEALYTIEAELRPRFTPGAAAAFQTWVATVGARMRGPVMMPEDDTPYWHKGPNPLAGFRSTETLPGEVDLLIIGAGLTGASAAYHAAQLDGNSKRIAVIDLGDPAGQASGRNGGNFELIPENFLGPYEGLATERYKYLKKVYPEVDEKTLHEQAERQARLIMRLGLANGERFAGIVTREGIDCDYSPCGWLRIAESREEEEAIAREVQLARSEGLDFELLSADDINRKSWGIPALFGGRLAPKSGNYHPFKFVCGVLRKAIDKGVALYTRVRVDAIVTGAGPVPVVRTAEGDIRATQVIVATNAFTSQLFPELEEIECYVSQIMTLEHVENRLLGMTITEKKGDLYYNFPRAAQYVDHEGRSRGMAHVGGGLDRPAPAPEDLQRSPSVLGLVKAGTDRRFPETRGQPPSRVWTGPMAFTPDRVPAIGFLRRDGAKGDAIVVAAGFNGYGGSYCVQAGHLAVQMVKTGETPDEVPEDVFSPHRFLQRAPLFPHSGRPSR